MTPQPFRWKALGSVLLLAAVVAACTPETRQQTAPATTATPPGVLDADERPPIIISDGSIDLYIDRNRNAGMGRGRWDDTTVNNMAVLTHIPDGSPAAVASFEVYLTNALGSAACEDPDTPYKAASLTITYGRLLKDDGTIEVGVANGNLTATFNKERQLDRSGTIWRSTGRGSRLKGVLLNLSAGGTAACTFDTGGKKKRGFIAIHQRK